MFNKKNKTILKVNGMHCEGCAKRIINSLKLIDGVSDVKVDLKNKDVIIYIDDSVNIEILKNIINNLGYEVI